MFTSHINYQKRKGSSAKLSYWIVGAAAQFLLYCSRFSTPIIKLKVDYLKPIFPLLISFTLTSYLPQEGKSNSKQNTLWFGHEVEKMLNAETPESTFLIKYKAHQKECPIHQFQVLYSNLFKVCHSPFPFGDRQIMK